MRRDPFDYFEIKTWPTFWRRVFICTFPVSLILWVASIFLLVFVCPLIIGVGLLFFLFSEYWCNDDPPSDTSVSP